jgi:hypothetical protein
MADTLDREHYDAVMSLLRADVGPPALKVYPDAEGFVPTNPTPPYVRVFFYIERPADDPGNSLKGASTTWTCRWLVHCVGANEYATIATAMRVNRALQDVRPTITGRTCWPIRQDGSNPPQRDESTGVLVVDRLDTYRLKTSG